MRKFKCYNCGHSWELPHGEGGRGIDLTCPECGSDNIHREQKGRGQGRRWHGRASESAHETEN